MSKKKITKNPKKNPKNKGGFRNFSSYVLSVVLIFLAITTAYSLLTTDREETKEVTISELAEDVREGLVESIVVSGTNLDILYEDETKGKAKKEVETSLTETLKNYEITNEQLASVSIEVKDQSGFGFWLRALLPILAPILFIVIFIWFLSRQVKGQSMQAFSFGQSKARVIDPDDPKQRVTFKDVAGAKEAKEELQEIVDFLKNPKKFLDIGARIPKGVMLMGAPGTGKTLLARAVAGEAGVPFLYLSGSEFVEMFVGVGASRVRDLFKMAKKLAPTIIFIDEIDAVGRHRGSGHGGGNDEREQTLNQILVEMDGFEPNEKIIIMAATNRPDVLDSALLRPGRFDRRVTLDLPDRKERKAILEIHGDKRPFHDDVDLQVIAERTPGFSGADLSNVMNEGAILAARENRKEVTQYDLLRSIEKVMLGPERKSRVMTKKDKKLTAYHETGHALVASVLPNADPIHKVSIISRGHAGGYTLKLPLEERNYQFKNQFLDDLAVFMGGYVAEGMIFGDTTTGPSSDIEQATRIARSMVGKYGMSDKIGPIFYGQSKTDGVPSTVKPYSEEVASELDKEVTRIVKEAEEKARKAINDHKDAFEGITQKLIEVETLERKEFEELLVKYGITPKKSEEDIEKEKIGEDLEE